MNAWLDELEQLNAERTQGHWWGARAEGDDHPGLDIINATAEHPIALDASEADAHAICAAMNALPALLRVARAAERYREAEGLVSRTLDPSCRSSYDDTKAVLGVVLNAMNDLFAAIDGMKGGDRE